MDRYRIENVSFARPPDWLSRTTACFLAPGPAPAPSIMMWREPLAAGDSLQAHAHRALVRFSQEVPGFQLAGSADEVVGGRPAYVVRFRFTDAGATTDQTLVMVDCATDAERFVTVFSTAARSDLADAARTRFVEVLKSVKFELAAGA